MPRHYFRVLPCQESFPVHILHVSISCQWEDLNWWTWIVLWPFDSDPENYPWPILCVSSFFKYKQTQLSSSPFPPVTSLISCFCQTLSVYVFHILHYSKSVCQSSHSVARGVWISLHASYYLHFWASLGVWIFEHHIQSPKFCVPSPLEHHLSTPQTFFLLYSTFSNM